MNDDRRLRALFAELRSRDETEAPDLDGLVSRPHAAPAGSLLPVFAFAVGLAGVVLLALLFRPARPDPGLISRWRSPTACLLPSQGSELLAGTPRVGESWLTLPTEVNR